MTSLPTRLRPAGGPSGGSDGAGSGDGPRGGRAGVRSLSRGRLIGLAAGLLVLVLLAVWVVAFSPLLGVRTVRVVGVSGADAVGVERAAGIAEGTPLLRLDAGAAQRRVAALPDIASVQVRTSWPSTVVITVTRRTPVGVVAQGSGFELVDATGHRYAAVTARPRHLPLFVLPPDSAAQARASGAAVAAVAAALPPDLLRRVRSIQAFDPASVTVLMRSGRVVHWGAADRDAEKAALVAVLLTRRSTTVDVSDPDHPFTR